MLDLTALIMPSHWITLHSISILTGSINHIGQIELDEIRVAYAVLPWDTGVLAS